MMKSQKMAAALVMFGMLAMVSPVVPGPVTFPDDSAGGNVVPGPVTFPDDSAGGNVVPGPVTFPDDSAGGN